MNVLQNSNQWLIDLSQENMWADEIDGIPSMLFYSYQLLRKLAQNGQVYGVMLQCKDLYEALYKIPTIMSLIIIENTPSNKEKDEYSDVIKASLSSPLSMGLWDKLANTIIKRSKAFMIPEELVNVLKATKHLYELEVSSDYPDVVNWRNGAIGHGALKFEDDPAYKIEIRNLLTHLKEYFEKGVSHSVRDLYRNIYFYTPVCKLVGDNKYDATDNSEIMLKVGDCTYTVTKYLNHYNFKLYLFNSFYYRKSISKYSSYIDGQEEVIFDQYFSRLYEKYVIKGNADFKLNSTLVTREQERALECLSMPSEYIKPVRLIALIKERIDELNKGVISVFMERGTGKSALANQMSGLFHKQSIIKRSFSRCYHVQNAALRGISDFVNAVNFNFKHSYDQSDDLWGSPEELPTLSMDDDPADALATFLNFYHEKYDNEYTIFVIDGIDELTEETKMILDFIPSRDQLRDGVIVLLLSRFKDEKSVVGNSVQFIEKAELMSDTSIQVRRNDTINLEPLITYIEKWRNNSVEKQLLVVDDLLRKADNRFLFLRAYLNLPYNIILDNTDEYKFVQSYMDQLFSLYGPSQNRKIKEMAVTFALFPSITIKQYQEYLNCLDLTYEFIGILNDLLPLLTVIHINGENAYEFADIAYVEYVLREYSDIILDVLHYFEISFDNHLKDYYSHTHLQGKEIQNHERDQLNQAIIFFGEGLQGISSKIDNNTIARWYFSNTKIWNLVGALATDPWARNGHGDYLKSKLLECVCLNIYYCVQNYQDKHVKEWMHVLYQNAIESRYKSKSYYIRSFRMTKVIVTHRKETDKAAQFLLDHPEIVIDNPDFIWLLQARKTLEMVEFIIENRIIIPFIKTLNVIERAWWYDSFLTYDLPPKIEEFLLKKQLDRYLQKEKEFVQYDTNEKDKKLLLILSKIRQKGYRVDPHLIPSAIDDLMKQVEEGTIWSDLFEKRVNDAIGYLKKMELKEPDSLSPDFNVYLSLKNEYSAFKNSDSVKKLHAAYYAKMCHMRENGKLSAFLEQEILLDDYISDILINEFGSSRKYYNELIKWIEIIEPCADKNHKHIVLLLSRMYIEAIEWLEKNEPENKEEIQKIKEEYILSGCDTRAFFACYFAGRISKAKEPEIIYSVPATIYCCSNTLCLLNDYYQTHLFDKFNWLLEHVEKSISLIDNNQITDADTEIMCSIAKFQFMKFRRELNIENSFDSYLLETLEDHNTAIFSGIKALSRDSNFNELMFRIRILMEYYWQNEKWQECVAYCDQLINQIKQINPYSDDILKESISKTLEQVERYRSFFNHVNTVETKAVHFQTGITKDEYRKLSRVKMSILGLTTEINHFNTLNQNNRYLRESYSCNVIAEGIKPYEGY